MSALPSVHTTTAPQLDLRFERVRAGHTWIAHQRAGYPFHVGRRLNGASEHEARVIVQSCSGGLFEHDRIAQRIAAADGALARIETAAATIVHTMRAGMATSEVHLDAHAGSRLDWLPEPTILFPQARLASSIEVVLHPGASAMITDAYLTHDPGGGEIPFGLLDAAIRVRDPGGRLLALDRFRLEPDTAPISGPLLGCDATGRPFTSHGGLFVLGAPASSRHAGDIVDALVHALRDADGHDAYAGAGMLPNGCGAFARVLATNAPALRRFLLLATEAASAVIDERRAIPNPSVSAK